MIETTHAHIIKAVCHVWEVSYKTIIKNTRNRESLYPRQMCMALMYEHLGLSYARIGLVMKRDNGSPFDHASVMHSFRSVNKLIKTDNNYKNKYLSVVNILETGDYPAAYPILDMDELIRTTDIFDSDTTKNIKTIKKILTTIDSYHTLLDKLLNDPDNTYLDEIEKIKAKTVALGSHLTMRIAGINQKLWHRHDSVAMRRHK